MTYQPYPTGDGANQLAAQPPAPKSIQNAVKLMYAGAGLSLLGIILSLATIGSLKKAIISKFPNYTTTQVHTAETVGVVSVIVVGVIGVALWLWMARANGNGRSYARIVAAVLFGLYTLDMILSFARAQGAVGLIFSLLSWLVGLGATIFLWRSDSSAYFAASKAR